MSVEESLTVRSPIGDAAIDSTGSPIGVVRMDPEKSYVGTPELLRQVIDEANVGAWETIKAKIDYTYNNLDHALLPLDQKAGFGKKIRAELVKGKKLLLKPNIVNPLCIDLFTHGRDTGYSACTAWPMVAALMRWFHDRLGISYHQMAIGEAATAVSAMAGRFSILRGSRVTPEAAIEGRGDDFYGGWGFYFVRRYLTETHDPSHEDDPMRGYEDSISGNYVPPGRAQDRLPVYDLNRIQAVPSRGRDVVVPNPAVFDSITLHKVIVGGDSNNPSDLEDYPGCVLVNVPKLKVHNITLLTNAIKNLGIGLYPMEAADDSSPASTRWKYSSPQAPVPGMKSRIPHQVWQMAVDDETGLPIRNEKGEYILERCRGISGTMADVIEATANQGVFILSIVDAIEATNLDHTGSTVAVLVPEGYVFAATDMVALDLLCSRYMFKTVPMAEALRLQKEQAPKSEFLQRVPLPKVNGPNIVTEEGVDSPISRYNLFQYAEERGLGQREYYVVGQDTREGSHLASLRGHLGRVVGADFSELITETMYFDQFKALWDIQATVLAYAEANDMLTGSNYRQAFLDAFDENGDGVIDYDEMGRKNAMNLMLYGSAYAVHLAGTERYGGLRGGFRARRNALKLGDPALNEHGYDLAKETQESTLTLVGLALSQLEMEGSDPFFPSMTWGKGKWPSMQFARYFAIGTMIYGMGYPLATNIISLYGTAFSYADKVFNGATYTGEVDLIHDPTCPFLENYLKAVADGAEPLPFLFYVPAGYGDCGGRRMPNVQETDDPAKVFTVEFAGGREVW